MKFFSKTKKQNMRSISIMNFEFSYIVRTRGEKNFKMFQNNEMTLGKMRSIVAKRFKKGVGYKPDLENPRSFNEKIQWLKFNYRNPLLTTCADKFKVKEYITSKIGSEYVVPNLACWNSAKDVDFDNLPEKFVLKVNWSSGYNIIVNDKSKLDIEDAITKINYWMLPFNNCYYYYFNWAYKNMPPVIYAEKYIEQDNGQLYDYKFHCFNGEPRFILVVSNRLVEGKETNKTFYDTDWNALPVRRDRDPFPDDTSMEKPRNFEKMLEISRILSKDFPFVRVDFYDLDDKVYIGEMTFYCGGGFEPFHPRDWDYKFGEMLDIRSVLQ
jgi:hypothetical protein